MKSFSKDIQGNMAMIFAVALMMIMVAVGAAVDMSSIHSKSIKYQGFADAAVLAAAISGEENLDALNKIAIATVDSNNFNGQKFRTKLTILDDGTFHVNVTASHDMMIMGIFGQSQQNISVIAESPPAGAANKLNLALVLDVTDSMSGTRIAALKTAATTLVEDISGGKDGETMFSVVPFATYVEIPTSYEGKSWLAVEPAGDLCYDTIDVAKSVNCRMNGSGEGSGLVCDTTVYMTICTPWEWKGCVNSRISPWNTRDYVGASKIQGFYSGDWCHSAMQPLTKSVSATKFAIDDMSTAQDTYMPAGLMWGWRTLSPSPPLTEANTPDQKERTNVLVLMSDGENSRSLGGKVDDNLGIYHWNINRNETDKLTADLCTKIKAGGIIIYTIAFEVTDVKANNMLKSCASDAGKFYAAKNSSQLKSAFTDIGNGLGEGGIRLSR